MLSIAWGVVVSSVTGTIRDDSMAIIQAGTFGPETFKNSANWSIEDCLSETFEKPLTKGPNGVYCRPLSTGPGTVRRLAPF